MSVELLTMQQENIIDRLGAENWQMVVDNFSGKSLEMICEVLDEMFPQDDNNWKLAVMINNWVN